MSNQTNASGDVAETIGRNTLSGLLGGLPTADVDSPCLLVTGNRGEPRVARRPARRRARRRARPALRATGRRDPL